MENKTYINTYFRIDTPAYDFGNSWTNESKNKFNEEIVKIFTGLGFTINEPQFSGSCYEVERGKERLYCHPQHLSGEVKEESIQEIEKAISNANTFKFRFIDTYEKLFDLTKEEVLTILSDKHKEKTIQEILKAYQTTRKTKFVYVGFNYVPVKTIEEREGKVAYREFINNLIIELVEQGLLIQMQSHKGKENYYRSLNKTELKQWEKQNGKLNIAV